MKHNLGKNKAKLSYRVALGIVLIIPAAMGVYFYVNHEELIQSGFKKETAAARVNNESIVQVDLEKKLDQTKNFFKYNKQDVSKMSSLEKDVLQNLIDTALIKQYAQEHNLKVSDSEVLNRYDLVVKGYNRHNDIAKGDTAFLSKIKEMYGTDKNTYLEHLKNDILKEKVQTAVKMPLKDWLEAQNKTADIKKY
jgi:hypothetical protein